MKFNNERFGKTDYLQKNIFNQNFEALNDITPPPETFYMLTEMGGNIMITESGNRMITE